MRLPLERGPVSAAVLAGARAVEHDKPKRTEIDRVLQGLGIRAGRSEETTHRRAVVVVAGQHVERRVDPGDVLAIAKHRYRVEYDPVELGAVGPPPADNLSQEVMRESLLSRAGLNHREIERARRAAPSDADGRKRYDPTNMKAGQIDLPDNPV